MLIVLSKARLGLFYFMFKFLIVAALFLSSCAYSATKTHNIAFNPYWLKLGHYQPSIFGSYESEVDSHTFFLSVNGKFDPHAELLASIAAFESENNDVACQFPARYQWLKKSFYSEWPDLSCPDIDKWQQLIDPKGMTLVFPTAFMNDPASMFGHTLLRIDSKDQTRSRELIAFAVNFAAEPDATDNAALYALKGLIGQYPGKFSLMPYYRKVRKYNDLESRDMWEYKLAFSELEIQRILLHLWELQWATFDYFFIDENCSYQLLALLQLARDDLNLTQGFSSHAIPSDTVKVLGEYGFLSTPRYRPASGTMLINFESQLTDEQIEIARQLKDGKPLGTFSLTAEQAVPVLEMAYEWLNYQYYDQGLAREAIAPRLTALLHQRSKLLSPSTFTKPVTPRISPDKGHDSSRFGMVFNNFKYSENRYGFNYRMAYHDLLDNAGGFIPGAQINFFDIEGDLDSDGNAYLEHVYLIDAMSLAPDNRLFDSWSWNVRVGFDRIPTSNKRKGRTFIQGGYGKSFGDASGFQSYFLASSLLQAGEFTDSASVGLGTEFGLIWQASDAQKLALTAQGFWLANDANTNHQIEFAAHWQVAVAQNWGVRSSYVFQNQQSTEQQLKLQLFHYF